MAITLFRLLLLLLPMGCGALVGKAQEREFYTKEIGVALGSNFMLNDANSTAFGHPKVGHCCALCSTRGRPSRLCSPISASAAM